ncbi:unnamed protein product [Brachionus calyciflorus]|uniref:Glutaredoxin domain-containing protein n=1 Tax=Brachionus calyciflorus TaxID=104777 RepID=A0A813PQS2_9BILA|nr:unnamed protein product [Brachionus calyciflorus]
MGASFNKSEITQNSTTNLYEDFIQKTVNSNKIVVFSKTNCSYCTRAKALLSDLNLEYNTIELDRNEQCPESNCQSLIKSLVYQTRIRTVPQIFINGQLIGGYTDLESMSRDKQKFQEFLNKKN